MTSYFNEIPRDIKGDRLLFPEVIKKVACPLFLALDKPKRKNQNIGNIN
jgi:hypothetical protein